MPDTPYPKSHFYIPVDYWRTTYIPGFTSRWIIGDTLFPLSQFYMWKDYWKPVYLTFIPGFTSLCMIGGTTFKSINLYHQDSSPSKRLCFEPYGANPGLCNRKSEISTSTVLQLVALQDWKLTAIIAFWSATLVQWFHTRQKVNYYHSIWSVNPLQ